MIQIASLQGNNFNIQSEFVLLIGYGFILGRYRRMY